MKFDTFPEEKELLIRTEAQNNIDRITADSTEQQEKLQMYLNSEKAKSSSGAIFDGMMSGAAFGFFVCFGVCTFDIMALNMDTPILELVSWGICILLGAIFAAIGRKTHEPKARAYEKQLQEEAERLQKDVKTITEDANLRCSSYRDAFESAVQEASAYFINNLITDEIVGVLWEQFKKQIDAADRSPSTQHISENFEFFTTENSVYTLIIKDSQYFRSEDKEEYSFDEHRVETLDLERMTALAKSLETALQLRGMTECAQDISGTIPCITVKSERITESERREVKSIVTYSAANGNYQQIRSW